MGVPLLGASIIVKNEQDHLRRCLSSIHHLCDEIVVVDTGSTDNTIAVAHEFGARVLERPWNDDFAAARNFSLDAITATWVMYIDADEEIVDTNHEMIRSVLRNGEEIAAVGVKLIAHYGWTPYIDYRVWRNKPEIKFRGEIHETTLPDIRNLAVRDQQKLVIVDLTIQHHGYEGDMTAKHHRNLPLLLAQLNETPRRINIWNHLGRVYAALGQFELAEKTWNSGIQIVEEDGPQDSTDVLIYASLADFLTRTGRDSSSIIEKALQISPTYMSLKWLLAQSCFAQGKISEAKQSLHELIGFDIKGLPISAFAYNKAMFNIWPLALLGDCHFELGEYDDAAQVFEQALEAGANPQEMRSKATACRMLNKK